MEYTITNGYEKRMSFDILIDLPITEIKKHIWFSSILYFGNDKNSFRFQPQFLKLIAVCSQKNQINAYEIEEIKQAYCIPFKDQNININPKNKFVIKNKSKSSILYNNRSYNLESVYCDYLYKPLYILDFLDDNGLDIKNTKFYFESVVDYIEKNNTINLKRINKQGWFDVSEKDVENIQNFFRKTEYFELEYKNWILNFNSEIKNFQDYQETKKYPKIKVGLFYKSPVSYLLDSSITISHNTLSSGDEGNEYVDLYKIFRKYPLDINVPFMSIKQDKTSKIKIDTNFTNKELIKKWSLVNDKIEDDKFAELNTPKGLLFKVLYENEYHNLTIYSNGKIFIKYNKSQSIDIPFVIEPVQRIIDFINDNIESAFIQEPYKLIINKNTYNFLNTELSYSGHFNQSDLKYVLNNPVIKHYLLSDIINIIDNESGQFKMVLKTVKITEKKSGRKEGEGKFLKGKELWDDVVLNLRKNSSYEDATLITISGLTSLNKLEFIKTYLNLIWFILGSEITEQVKQTNKNKALKNIDKLFDARDCQKQKQPIVSDDIQPQKGSYALNYKGNRIICNSQDYPYPGFTSKGNVCCFKKDQRRTAKFINMMEAENNFLVQPTNIKYTRKIKNTDKTNGKQEILQYPVILKQDKLYYLEGRELKILPQDLAQKIWKDEEEMTGHTFFLNEVPFSRIISLPPEGICSDIYQNKENGSFFGRKGYNFFGYNKEGYPCFFRTKPESRIESKAQTKISISKHVITTDKILQPGRVGTIPDIFRKILKPLIKDGQEVYRLGITPGPDNFLTSVSKSVNKPNKYIQNQIKEKLDYNLFLSLSNGEMALKFNYNFKQFKKFLNSSELKTQEHLWDLLEYCLNINIIILDSKTENILCHSRNYVLDTKRDLALILKIGNSYEPILILDSEGIINKWYWNIKSELYQAYLYICQPRNRIPDNIKYQILDPQNKTKVKFFILQNGFWFPAADNIGPVANIPIKSMSKKKPDALRLYQLASQEHISIKGQILEPEKEQFVIGLLSENDIIIPTKKSKIIPNLSVLKGYIYFPKAENKYKKAIKEDARIKFINNKYEFEKSFHELKYQISQDILNKKLISQNPVSYVPSLIAQYPKTNLLSDDKWYQYIIDRLIYDIQSKPEIMLFGKVPKIYKEEYYFDNQVIITDSRKLFEYISTF